MVPVRRSPWLLSLLLVTACATGDTLAPSGGAGTGAGTTDGGANVGAGGSSNVGASNSGGAPVSTGGSTTTTTTTTTTTNTTGMVGCGDGMCSAETCSSCPADCGSCCGNGSCDNGETTSTCPADCPNTCGNGTCDANEDAASCPADCSSGSCDHDPCVTGGALALDCDPCVFLVCTSTPTCCLLGWDSSCVAEAQGQILCGC